MKSFIKNYEIQQCHKHQDTRRLIESANCNLLYLPPYSPDFNPIEQKWGHVKNRVKKIRDQFREFTECLESVLVRAYLIFIAVTTFTKIMGEFMAKAYSLDLRQRVFDLLAKGHTKLFIEETLGVCTKTILKWQRRYEETGSIDKIIPTITKPRKVNYKKAKKFIENNPDKTLKEIGFAIGTKNALYVIKKLNITYKKTVPIRGEKGRFEKRVSGEVKPDSKE